MKSIVYIFIALMISSILITAFPKTKLKSNQTLTFQCVNENHTSDLLSKSASIFQNRLRDYGIQDAAVVIDEKMSSIDVSLDNSANLPEVTALLTSKGRVEFYETFDRLEVIKNLGINKDLASILNIPKDSLELDRFSGIYGYCKGDNKSKVELFLKNNYVSKAGNGINFYWSEKPNSDGYFYLFILQSQASLNNSLISKSFVQRNSSNDNLELNISFNKAGTAIWKDITKRNIGKTIALVLDRKVLQSPKVVTEISGGKCILSSDISLAEISRINSLINNEELPLEFKLKN